MFGGADNDTLYGGDCNDSRGGGTGADQLYGGADNDPISDDAGTLSGVQGGAGDNRIEPASTILTGTIDGGADRDALRNQYGNLTGLTLSNIEMLETQFRTVRAILAQIEWRDQFIVETMEEG